MKNLTMLVTSRNGGGGGGGAFMQLWLTHPLFVGCPLTKSNERITHTQNECV